MHEMIKVVQKVDLTEFNGYTTEDVVWMFQNSDNKKFKNKCYATVFKRVYPMIMQIYNKPKFGFIPFEDKTEQCLESLLKALSKYNVEKGYKFSTYIYTSINNALISLGTNLCRAKNNAFNNLYTSEKVDYVLQALPYKNSRNNWFECLDLVDTSLDETESYFCKQLLKGFNAKQVSYNLSYYVQYDKTKRTYKTIPINDDNRQRCCSQIRRNIKNKLQPFRQIIV